MAKCLSCYLPLDDSHIDYHPKCARSFFGSQRAPALSYQLSELEELARESAKYSISVPGVQPKLSLGELKSTLGNSHESRLTIMDALEGQYILKPQNTAYPQMPENEHLSMRLAALFRMNTVPANMIRLASGELCFITRRIDRNADGSKNHMIDFMQILELSDKYKGTMEHLGKTIGELSVNTLYDKLQFFESTMFNYVIGNNDMHLKNYSMFLSDMGWVLAPFYDLLNVKIILPEDKDDMALLFGGKKRNFSKAYFDRFGAVLNLNTKQIASVYKKLEAWYPPALQLIDQSFLEDDLKQAYKDTVTKSFKRLG